MDNQKNFISFGYTKELLLIMQMHDIMVEMETNPTTQQIDIDQSKNDIKEALIGLATRFFIQRDIISLYTIYLKYEDVKRVISHEYNYNKLLLTLKK